MSQFDALFKTNTKARTETKRAAKPESVTAKRKTADSLSPAPDKKPSPPAKVATAAKSEKRASGKSSNADYTQVLSYIKRDTHRAVKKALFDDLQNRDLSELVEELLTGWLEKNS
jgi:hypothetical protein